MNNAIKSTKVFAGKYQVIVEGYKTFYIQQHLNHNCEPSGMWNLLCGHEWLDMRCTKKECLDLLKEAIGNGSLKSDFGI